MRLTEFHAQDFIDSLYKEFPKLKIHRTRPWWLRLAFKAMFWNEYNYWDSFTTTIGLNIYLAPEWDAFSPTSRVSILRHEREHLKQFSKYGLLLMAIIYLFLPFPTIFALGRAYFEKAGYDESVRAAIEYYELTNDDKEDWKEYYTGHFINSSYFWMFPFKSVVNKWFDKTWDSAIGQ